MRWGVSRPTSFGGREGRTAEVEAPVPEASLRAVVEGSLAREAWLLAVAEGLLEVPSGRVEVEEPLVAVASARAAVASARAAVEGPLAVSLAAGWVTKAMVAAVEVPSRPGAVAGAGSQG